MVAKQLLFPIPSYPVLLVNISQKITIISPFVCIPPKPSCYALLSGTILQVMFVGV